MADKDDRINQVEKELAVLEHRVNELEDTPPRVNLLENSVNQLEVQFKHMNDDLSELNNHRLKPVGSYYGLKVRIRVKDALTLTLSPEVIVDPWLKVML